MCILEESAVQAPEETYLKKSRELKQDNAYFNTDVTRHTNSSIELSVDYRISNSLLIIHE